MRCDARAEILHADLDSFYASVEQRDDPSLRGRPVIVGGGVVLAVSYEARADGVRTAMNGGQARRLCPSAIVVEPRMSAYAEASKAVYRVFDDTSPLVEGLSIDEAFLDVRGMERLAGTPAEIAARLRREPDGELAFLHLLPVERLGSVIAGKLRGQGMLSRAGIAFPVASPPTRAPHQPPTSSHQRGLEGRDRGPLDRCLQGRKRRHCQRATTQPHPPDTREGRSRTRKTATARF